MEAARSAPARAPLHVGLAAPESELELVDVDSLLRPLVRRRPAGVQLVQVGACDGDFGEGETTSDDPVQRLLLEEASLRALLLEPHPGVFGMLHENVRQHFGESTRIRLMNVAVAAEECSGSMPFYVVSPRFAAEHPRRAAHWAKYQLSSLDREHVLNHCEFVGLSREAFAEYVDEIQVRCLTPVDLLREAHLLPEDVDVLQVDAEGHDDKIVEAFFALPGFRPELVIFEATHLDREEAEGILASFRAQGYYTGWVRPRWQVDRAPNAVAWLPPRS